MVAWSSWHPFRHLRRGRQHFAKYAMAKQVPSDTMDTQQLMSLITITSYLNKEIVLCELINNASGALGTVQKDMKLLPLMIAIKIKKPFSNAEVTGEPKDMRADDVFAVPLTKVKATAEKNLGKEVKHAVAGMPAYFNEAQRQPKKGPNTNSGMNILQIICEPTAAIAHGLDGMIETES
eukprot:1915118-Pyramimonas_sp.AAC.1